jgi:hypothetical protein
MVFFSFFYLSFLSFGASLFALNLIASVRMASRICRSGLVRCGVVAIFSEPFPRL